MSLVTWILAGAVLGGAASAIIGIRDRKGVALNVVTGVAGVMCGGWLLGVLIGASAFSSGDFSLPSLLVSLMGATVLLAVLQLSRGALANEPRTRPGEASTAFEIPGTENRRQSEMTEMNLSLGAARSLRPLVMAGLAGILLLVGACASAPLAPDPALDATPRSAVGTIAAWK